MSGVQCAALLGCSTDAWVLLGSMFVGLTVAMFAYLYVVFLPRNYCAGGEEST